MLRTSAQGPSLPPPLNQARPLQRSRGAGLTDPIPKTRRLQRGVCHEPHRQPRPARGLKIRWAGAFGDFDCTASVHTQPGLKAETHQSLSQPCRGGRSPPDSQPGARRTVSYEGLTAQTPRCQKGESNESAAKEGWKREGR